MLHALEMTDVLDHHLAEGALGPLARPDQARHLRADGGVIQDTQVDVEQGVIFRVQLRAEIVRHCLDIGPHTIQRLLESAQFPAAVLRPPPGYRVQVRRGRNHHCSADSDTRRTRHAVDLGRHPLARENADTHRAGNPGMGNHTRQLGGHGDQEGLFTLIETALGQSAVPPAHPALRAGE